MFTVNGPKGPFPPSSSTSSWTTIVETSPFGEGSGFVGAGTRKVYVSSSSGNDSNTGTLASPVATIAHGVTLLRDGKSDWLLLKKGDTWTDDVPAQLTKSGPGMTGTPGGAVSGVMLFGTYGSGARPIIQITPTITPFVFQMGVSGGFGGKGSNTAIIGWDMYSPTRDPANGLFNVTTLANDSAAIVMQAHGTNLLVEDCRMRFQSGALDFEPQAETYGVTFWTNLWFRRNQVLDSYIPNSRCQGLFMDACIGTVVFEDNLFDQNGWNPNVSGADQRDDNHNFYAANNNSTSPLTIRNNIFSNNPGGEQFRPGGTIYNNLFLHNASAFIAYENSLTVIYNVVQEACDVTGVNAKQLQWGISLTRCVPPCVVDHNIISNSIPNTAGFGIDVEDSTNAFTGTFTSGSASITSVSDPTGNGNGNWPAGLPLTGPHIQANTTVLSASGFDGIGTPGTVVMSKTATGTATETFSSPLLNAVVTNNYVFNQHGGIINGATGTTLSGNVDDPTGTNGVTIPPEPFSAPTRTIGGYAGTIGLTATTAAFITAARGQSKDAWNVALMANAVNNYIRTGFGMPLQ